MSKRDLNILALVCLAAIVMMFISPALNGALVAKPFYRFFQPGIRADHFYTTNELERNYLLDSTDWIDEGLAGYIFNEPVNGTVPLYRYYNEERNDHFLARTQTQRERAEEFGWEYQGIAGYVHPDRAEHTTPLYGQWSPLVNDHFYTINYSETQAAMFGGYRRPYIFGWVYTEPYNLTQPVNYDLPYGLIGTELPIALAPEEYNESGEHTDNFLRSWIDMMLALGNQTNNTNLSETLFALLNQTTNEEVQELMASPARMTMDGFIHMNTTEHSEYFGVRNNETETLRLDIATYCEMPDNIPPGVPYQDGGLSLDTYSAIILDANESAALGLMLRSDETAIPGKYHRCYVEITNDGEEYARKSLTIYYTELTDESVEFIEDSEPQISDDDRALIDNSIDRLLLADDELETDGYVTTSFSTYNDEYYDLNVSFEVDCSDTLPGIGVDITGPASVAPSELEMYAMSISLPPDSTEGEHLCSLSIYQYHLEYDDWVEYKRRYFDIIYTMADDTENVDQIICGDGEVQGTEQCDDGNLQNGDGCSDICLWEPDIDQPPPVCGDGVVVPPEECDDGNLLNGDGCSDICMEEPDVDQPPPVCGDGIITPPEECDDGGTEDDDGCSAECMIQEILQPPPSPPDQPDGGPEGPAPDPNSPPDLTFTSVDVNGFFNVTDLGGPNMTYNIEFGVPWNFGVTVENTGTGTAGASDLFMMLSDECQGGTELGSQVFRTYELYAGSNQPYEWGAADIGLMPNGTYCIIAEADHSSELVELNEANNRAERKIKILDIGEGFVLDLDLGLAIPDAEGNSIEFIAWDGIFATIRFNTDMGTYSPGQVKDYPTEGYTIRLIGANTSVAKVIIWD